MLEIRQTNNFMEWNNFYFQEQIATPLFQTSEWCEVEKKMGKNILAYEIFSSKDKIGQMLITIIAAKRGQYLHIRNGPVLKSWNDNQLLAEIIRWIIDFAKARKCDFIRISPKIESNLLNKELMRKYGFSFAPIHNVDAEVTWILEIDKTEEELLAKMRKNTRYAINRAIKDGVTIIKSQNPADIDHFWPIFEDTVKRQKWTPYSLEYIKNEFAIFAAQNKANLFLAQYQGQYIAAAIFIYINDTAYYHHSGSLTAFLKIPAPYLVQWESIKEAKSRNIKYYNFFGIAPDDNPKNPWAGLTFFKKGFGGYKKSTIHAQDHPLTIKYWLTFIFELFEKKKRGY